MSDKSAYDSNGLTVINNVHSLIGSNLRMWVIGIICQREDGQYYIEDSTYTVKLSFSDIEYVQPDAFFTENCIILANGRFENGIFYVMRVMHPPLHKNKSLKYAINEQDYFGSYIKMTELIQ